MSRTMSKTSHHVVILAVAAGLFSATSAQACGWTSCGQPAPAYRYVVQPHRYVVQPLPAMTELVPNVYLIDRHRWYRDYPYVYCGFGCTTNTDYYYRYGVTAPAHRGLIGEVRRRPRVVHEARKPRRGETRVIRANAEVTIIGPDRMNIRLYRKGRGSKNR
jgi:hypothetical protein